MAHAEKGKHGAVAFVFGFAPSSRPLDLPTPRTTTPGLLAAVIWATGLAVGILGNACVLLDPTAYERWSRAFDGLGCSWACAIAGYALIVCLPRSVSPHGSAIRAGALSLLALFGWTYHLLLVRWSFLTAAVPPSSRLSVYAGALSRSWESLPVFAFGELLGSALLITHATLYLLEAARQRGWLLDEGSPSRAQVVIVAMALAVYFLSATVTIQLATGRI
jgi:hypothetical protein